MKMKMKAESTAKNQMTSKVVASGSDTYYLCKLPAFTLRDAKSTWNFKLVYSCTQGFVQEQMPRVLGISHYISQIPQLLPIFFKKRCRKNFTITELNSGSG
jgi:hypothetical protein